MTDDDFEIIAKEIIYMALADGQPAMTLPGAIRELRALAYDVRKEALEVAVAALIVAVETEREACRKECHFVADQHISTELRNVALQCEAAIWSRSTLSPHGEGK